MRATISDIFSFENFQAWAGFYTNALWAMPIGHGMPYIFGILAGMDKQAFAQG